MFPNHNILLNAHNTHTNSIHRNRLTMPKRSQQTGFTLLELMIVVAIIGILASIAIPSYKGYIREAQTATLIGNFDNAIATVSNEFYLGLAVQARTGVSSLPTNSNDWILRIAQIGSAPGGGLAYEIGLGNPITGSVGIQGNTTQVTITRPIYNAFTAQKQIVIDATLF